MHAPASYGDVFHNQHVLRGNVPLSAFFTPEEWDFLTQLNEFTRERLHATRLPVSPSDPTKNEIIVPAVFFFPGLFRQIAVKTDAIFYPHQLIVHDEQVVSSVSSAP
jgi:hypothetical protein